MNNCYHLNKNSFVDVRNNINNHEIGGLKKLTQEQRRILKIGVQIINSEGPGLIISKETGLKIVEPSNYEKNICATICKTVNKIFNKYYIDFNELSDLVSAMELDDNPNNDKNVI